MGTVWVECWKCDVCGHRWIKGELWPEQCGSSKCRSRRWNASAKSASAVEQAQASAVEREAERPAVASEPLPVADVSALPVVDRLAVARAAVAAVGSPVGVVLPPVAVGEPCPYTEPDYETGFVYACGMDLEHKGKHTRGVKVGDIFT